MNNSLKLVSLAALTAATFALPAAAGDMKDSAKSMPSMDMSKCCAKCSAKCCAKMKRGMKHGMKHGAKKHAHKAGMMKCGAKCGAKN